MLKLRRTVLMLILSAITLCGMIGKLAHAADYEPIKNLVDKYRKAGNDNQRKEVAVKLIQTEPKTQEDMDSLRKVFQKRDWDEYLFAGAAESLKRTKDPSLDKTLIEILNDEKSFIEKLGRNDHRGKSGNEANYRLRNVEVVIGKLGEFKSRNAVPVLKEYLAIQGAAYWASQALSRIGDKSAGEQMREKAYKGEEVNYGGLGLDEAINIVKDLEDRSKKDKWPKITKQLIMIRDPRAKPYLKRLFKHEKTAVQEKSAMAYSNLVNISDVNDIIEMSKNSSWTVRAFAIESMKHLNTAAFDDVLINLLLNDPHRAPRYGAAKAIGLSKIQKGAPSLEIALKDKELYVRQNAYIALYMLTGKKYEFEGKTAEIEQRAEFVKERPYAWP